MSTTHPTLRRQRPPKPSADAQKTLWARMRRRVLRQPVSEDEAADLVAAFLRKGGAVTVGPAACAAPIRNGDGLVPYEPKPPKAKRLALRNAVGQYRPAATDLTTTKGTARKRRLGPKVGRS